MVATLLIVEQTLAAEAIVLLLMLSCSDWRASLLMVSSTKLCAAHRRLAKGTPGASYEAILMKGI
jgi:hypothetical protein